MGSVPPHRVQLKAPKMKLLLYTINKENRKEVKPERRLLHKLKTRRDRPEQPSFLPARGQIQTENISGSNKLATKKAESTEGARPNSAALRPAQVLLGSFPQNAEGSEEQAEGGREIQVLTTALHQRLGRGKEENRGRRRD